MISQILMISQSLNDFRCISYAFTNKENCKIFCCVDTAIRCCKPSAFIEQKNEVLHSGFL